MTQNKGTRRDAEGVALAAEGAKWAVYQEAVTSGEVAISDLLDFAVEFYEDDCWSSQLLAALDYESGVDRYADEIDAWETRNSAEYKTYLALRAKYTGGE